MNITVYAIALNEEKHVQRFCESVRHADSVVIVDTGSTDNTVEIAQDHGAQVHEIRVRPWRFDHARNAAMALLPANTDVCVSLDLDEYMTDNWRDILEQTWNKNTTRMRYKYSWAPNQIFYTDKIHHRYGYSWRHPCHEILVPDKRISETFAQTDELLVIHNADNLKPRTQYLQLLELDYQENPHNARSLLYYGRELFFNFKNTQAQHILADFLSLRDIDPLERDYAHRLMAKISSRLQHDHGVYTWLSTAAENNVCRESWVDLAQYHYEKESWQECLQASKQALTHEHPNGSYTQDPVAWGSRPHDLAAVAAWNLGLFTEAQQHAQLALNLEPSNPRLQENLKLMQNMSK